MSELVTLQVALDDAGCLVIATADDPPPSPALLHVHWIGPDLLIEADAVDPARFVRLTITLDPDDSSAHGLAARLLGVDLEETGTEGTGTERTDSGAPSTVDVDPARLALLGRLAAVGASHDAAAPARANPWWAVESHVTANKLGCPDVAFGEADALLDAVMALRWLDVGGVADAATAAVDLLSTVRGVAAGGELRRTLDLVPADLDDALVLDVVEVGVLPTLDPGLAVEVPLSEADAEPGVFDLANGATVVLTDDGRSIEVEVPVADGVYLQAAYQHRVQVQRLDADLIVGEAALESSYHEHVAAAIRLSRFTRSRPLALRLFHQRQTTMPTRQVVVARAADAHAKAGAALARLGANEAAGAEFARAAEWWRSIGHDEVADTADGAVESAAATPPLLGEALRAEAPPFDGP